MEVAGSDQITRLLHDWRGGRPEALGELMPLVYDQLRVLARSHLNRENPGHTLRPTELVHEAFLKLAGSQPSLEDRAHFYALASTIIRHMLSNYGKAKRTQKRGSGAAGLPLDEEIVPGVTPAPVPFSEIDEALERLHLLDPRKARLVDLTYFAGLDQEQAAETVGISPATVRRELRLAKAWLYNELHPDAGRPACS
jgi:RNA polymerase sigma factor (TIGR02999 family)